jgi:hypothetical protein
MAITRPTHRQSLWWVAVSALGGTALLAACGSSGSGATAAGSAPSAPASASAPAASSISCSSIASLRKSLTNLDQLQVNAQTSGQVAADIGNIDTQLTALRTQAQGTYASQSTQLTVVVQHVTGDVRTLAAHPTVANLEVVETAVSALRASSQSLITELKAACPGS